MQRLLLLRNFERGPSQSDGRYIFSERRGFGRCKRRPHCFVHRCFRDKGSSCNEECRGIKTMFKKIMRLSYFSFADSLSYSFADFCG